MGEICNPCIHILEREETTNVDVIVANIIISVSPAGQTKCKQSLNTNVNARKKENVEICYFLLAFFFF